MGRTTGYYNATFSQSKERGFRVSQIWAGLLTQRSKAVSTHWGTFGSVVSMTVGSADFRVPTFGRLRKLAFAYATSPQTQPFRDLQYNPAPPAVQNKRNSRTAASQQLPTSVAREQPITAVWSSKTFPASIASNPPPQPLSPLAAALRIPTSATPLRSP